MFVKVFVVERGITNSFDAHCLRQKGIYSTWLVGYHTCQHLMNMEIVHSFRESNALTNGDSIFFARSNFWSWFGMWQTSVIQCIPITACVGCGSLVLWSTSPNNRPLIYLHGQSLAVDHAFLVFDITIKEVKFIVVSWLNRVSICQEKKNQIDNFLIIHTILGIISISSDGATAIKWHRVRDCGTR